MKTFVIGDIHGQHKALVECLKLCGFDYEKDRLIALGDVCDRGSKVKESIDELLKIRHLVYLLGNHDAWTLEWAIYGQYSEEWMKQGGAETAASYNGIAMPKSHIALLAGAPLYFEEGKRLFVHAGFDVDRGVKGTPDNMFIWDRGLAMEVDKLNEISPDFRVRGYDEIFLGHTPTTLFNETVPRKCCNVWMLDTGAGVGGKLTVMDVETKQFWQADCGGIEGGVNRKAIANFIRQARKFGLVEGMVGGEERGYISPEGDFIDLAGWKSHDNLAKAFGFTGSAEVIEAGLIRVANTSYDMEYEFVVGNETAFVNVNASISWNIGMDKWPKKALILINIVGQGRYKTTVEDFVNAGGDLKAAIAKA